MRDPTPVYQSIAARDAEMHNRGLSLYRIAHYLGVNDHTAAKALRSPFDPGMAT